MRLNHGWIDKRKLARVLAVVAVALAAGHLVQTMAERKLQSQPRIAQTEISSRPKAIVPLAGTSDAVPPQLAAKAPMAAAALAATSPVPFPDPSHAPPPDAPTVVADPCPVTLDLMADPGAMIGLTLLAPCRPGERVVLRHAGLAVTAVTTATGSLFLALPALETSAAVEVRFADGTEVSGVVTFADLAAWRRFGVQWQGDDAFQIYGIEPAATLSAANPGPVPAVDLPQTGGFLTRLGDATADTPLLAEIYTFPKATSAKVVVEVAVTPTTCGREILGETLASIAGRVTVTDLSLAMPECDAVGDFLVLYNLAPDLTLAAAK